MPAPVPEPKRICRFSLRDERPRLGLIEGEAVRDLSKAFHGGVIDLLEQASQDPGFSSSLPSQGESFRLGEVTLHAPVDQQEIWAAGVTYLRSRDARMDESDFSASAYDRVYNAERPELFFKALAHKAVGPREPVGIRRDAKWSVPEPELALAINPQGQIRGCTIGNDMSSRDIEGENALYLPQAKVYRNSCALGPWITLEQSEETMRRWTIAITIERAEKSVFEGTTSVDNIKRRFSELASFLFRSQSFPHGVILLTGTGIVPPDDFTLQENDRVKIEISGIGTLENPVAWV